MAGETGSLRALSKRAEWQIGEQAVLSAMSHVERFEATRNRLRELGLPEAIPWAMVRTP